jgi:DNA-binding NtrC family response regulator
MRKKQLKDISNSSNINILIIDDEIGFLEIMKNSIEKNGYNCIITKDIKETIEIVKKRSPIIDIIITDYLMIDITAEEVISEIRKIDKDVYIILQTGYSQNMPSLYAMKNLEIDSFSEKDTDLEDIMLKIEIAVKSINKLKNLLNKLKK